jgi:nucleotide-binding universal stress UspA family protein
MTNVVACIDGSSSAPAVCDYAAWAALRLQAPLTFLHVLDRSQYPANGDLSGSIGLGARESLLEELARLDEQRGKLALEQGKLMLEEARKRALADGIGEPLCRQRHGDLVETLAELEGEIRLLVLGRQGEDHTIPSQHIGSHLERVIRTMHRPILVTPADFAEPQRIMLAYDGSTTTRKGVEMIAASPLFKGLPCHLVMAGADTAEAREHLKWAQATLEKAGFEAPGRIVAGDVEPVLNDYRQEHRIDLIVMGAYGHSKIRQFLVGSTTTNVLRQASIPLLLLR